MFHFNQKPLKLTQPATSNHLVRWIMRKRNPSLPSSLSTFLYLKPTIAVIHLCRWKVTAEEPRPLLSKPKRRGEALGPPVTWERPGLVHAFAIHTRGPPLDDTKAGREKDKEGGQQRSERKGPHLSFLSSISFHLGYPERIGATCVRERASFN